MLCEVKERVPSIRNSESVIWRTERNWTESREFIFRHFACKFRAFSLFGIAKVALQNHPKTLDATADQSLSGT